MIHWKDIDQPMTDKEKRKWKRNMCAAALWGNGRCEGYSGSADDDEPCEVCKACDKLGIEVDDD